VPPCHMESAPLITVTLFLLHRTFRVIDDNRSRTLDREELANGLRDFNVSMSRAEVNQLFDELDKDNSGHISFDEFLQALRVREQF